MSSCGFLNATAQETSPGKTPVKAMPVVGERIGSAGVLDPPDEGPAKVPPVPPPPPPLHLFSARDKGSMDSVARQRYDAAWQRAEQNLQALWRMEAQYNYAEMNRVAKAMPTTRPAWVV